MKKNAQKSKEVEKKDIKDIEEPSEAEPGEIVVDQEKVIEDLQQKSGEYLDGWKRCQADFENYKKLQAEKQSEMIKYASSSVVLQVIPVLDNFHASTEHVPEDQKDNAWVTGIMYIQKQLETVLSDNGVEAIEPKVGDDFDPNMHEAVEDTKNTNKETNETSDIEKTHPVESAESGAEQFNRVKRVVLKGYKMGERVIRAARVVVE